MSVEVIVCNVSVVFETLFIFTGGLKISLSNTASTQLKSLDLMRSLQLFRVYIV